MKIMKLLIVILIIFLFAAGLTAIIYSNFLYIDLYKVYAEVLIGEHGDVGLAGDTDSLVFGRIAHGGASMKGIVMTNTYEEPLEVNIRSDGTIADLLDFEPVVFLEINQTKKIDISVQAGDYEQGNYSGAVTFIIRKG